MCKKKYSLKQYKKIARQVAANRNDLALVQIGRTAGEDQDHTEEHGSFLLTETEFDLLQKVCKIFSRSVIVLNVGNIIDMSWVNKVKPSAILYVWQGGQEGGNGVTGLSSCFLLEEGIYEVYCGNSVRDTKWNQNAFFMEPVSIANLHNNKSERNFWCCTKENGCWSAVGASAESEARKFGAEEDQTILEGSVLIYRSGRNRYLCSGKS